MTFNERVCKFNLRYVATENYTEKQTNSLTFGAKHARLPYDEWSQSCLEAPECEARASHKCLLIALQ